MTSVHMANGNGGGGESGPVGCAQEYKDNFERVRELGKGKFGIVYEVRRKDGVETFAAKHVRTRRRELRLKALEEASLLGLLHSPRIIRLIAVFESSSEVILLTELLSGGELFERVASDLFTLTEEQCVLFMRQICEGVHYLHERNIVHLDLKPENIVCCQPDSTDVKLVDFGLAKMLLPGEEVKVMCGTAEFVSPEVVNYDPVSPASDIWSLGVISYVLLSGLSPFMGDNVSETYSNVVKAEYDFEESEFDDITLEAKHFISSLLVREPKKRLRAEECLRHPWLKMEEGGGGGGGDGGDGVHSCPLTRTKKINTTNLRRFLARRRWQRCGQAIRAMKRMSGLMQRKRSHMLQRNDSSSSNTEEDSSSNSGEQSQLQKNEDDDEDDVVYPDFIYSRNYRSTIFIEIGKVSLAD